ncbi:MAG: N-acetylmuramoyl-L-alanine amidase [Bacteroidaceae bacterium]|nr:N-acetylmuramoyl-L-alanine amidase [Bacteroidaceae bacterium]
MRSIAFIILHCSATRCDQSYSFEACKRDHLKRGFTDIGYHWYIECDGTVHEGRKEELVGAHCKERNKHSIGVCYEGGLNENGQFADTRTEAQKDSLLDLLIQLHQRYPEAVITGHNEFNPHKACPCFDAEEYRAIFSI